MHLEWSSAAYSYTLNELTSYCLQGNFKTRADVDKKSVSCCFLKQQNFFQRKNMVFLLLTLIM